MATQVWMKLRYILTCFHSLACMVQLHPPWAHTCTCTQILKLHLLINMFKPLKCFLQHEIVFTIYALSNTSLHTYAFKRMFICTWYMKQTNICLIILKILTGISILKNSENLCTVPCTQVDWSFSWLLFLLICNMLLSYRWVVMPDSVYLMSNDLQMLWKRNISLR